jgi:hypothetical protein
LIRFNNLYPDCFILNDYPAFVFKVGYFLVLVFIVLIGIIKSVLMISALTKTAMNRIEWDTK